jgi:hypothetical protein
MNAFVRNVDKLVPTATEKAKMTQAGADVLADALKTATRAKHYQPNRSIANVKHLADSITTEPQNTGDTLAGYETADESGINHARIARLLNDGWKSHEGDHFHSEALKAAESAVFEAEHKVYDQLKGGDAK